MYIRLPAYANVTPTFAKLSKFIFYVKLYNILALLLRYNGYNYERVVEIIVANNRVNMPGIGGHSYDTLSLVWLLKHC